jgi:hypothetical protein
LVAGGRRLDPACGVGRRAGVGASQAVRSRRLSGNDDGPGAAQARFGSTSLGLLPGQVRGRDELVSELRGLVASPDGRTHVLSGPAAGSDARNCSNSGPSSPR